MIYLLIIMMSYMAPTTDSMNTKGKGTALDHGVL